MKIDKLMALCQTCKMKKFWNTIALLLPFFIYGSAFAGTNSPKSYQVAIIVFSQISGTALDSEQWPRIAPQQDPSEYTAMDNNASNYALSANDSFVLNNELQRIMKKPQYTVLLQKSWIIPVKQFDNNVTLHLYGGQAYDTSGKALKQAVTDESSAYSIVNTWEMNGTLNINIRRYFNLTLNLTFAEPSRIIDPLSNNGYFENNSDPYVYFKLNQTRRMRSNELNYIGHPLFGVLVKIMPSQDDPQQQNNGQNTQKNA